MGDHEADAQVAVPAVPAGQPVETGDPLERRQPRQQDDLDEREVAADQPREGGKPREEIGGAVRRQVVVCDPEPAEEGDVAEVDRPGDKEREAVRGARACAVADD
jgi:hypothetical protein